MSILLISNQAACLEQLMAVISRFFPDIQLSTFLNPLSAIPYLIRHKETIEAIFSVVVMQPIDGLKLLDVVISTSGYIPFYFISTIDSPEFTQLVKSRGAIDCLKLPLIHQEITDAITFIQDLNTQNL